MNNGSRVAPFMEPKVSERSCGGWLATSPAGAALKIGVVGQSEADARERFIHSVDCWRQNLQAGLAR